MTKGGALPPELGSVFSTREALSRGVTPGRLRSRELVTPFAGVRSASEAKDVWDQARQYLPRMRPGQFFSHLTAARMYGIPLPRAFELRKELDVSAPASRPRLVGVTGHRAAATPVRVHRGLPLTRPDWLFAELATQLTLDDLIIAGDALVRKKRPPTSLAELHAIVAARDTRGIRTALEAICEVRSGTDSPMETRMRLVIVRGGLPEPLIGHTVTWPDGGFIGTPDLAYVAERVAIEYEGAHHRNDPLVFAADIERREQMQEAGWYVIRVISDHVFAQPGELVARVSRVLAERRIR
jgi:Protein of unknown function (DUF559)